MSRADQPRGVALPYFHPADDPGSSFSELLGRLRSEPLRFETLDAGDVVHGTTIVALKYEGGAVLAGDRRATAGNLIAHRTMEKVRPADHFSGVGIAGAAGAAMEMVRLFQTELEHYEKVEGSPLSLEGKANKLAQMIRAHLPAAMQGLAVVPIFAGYDTRRETGRIFTFDVTGGAYEETDFSATGSGGRDARSVVKMRWRPGLDPAEAALVAASALFEAADEDSATGGPDVLRGIYPQIATIDASGFAFLDEERVAELFATVATERRSREGTS